MIPFWELFKTIKSKERTIHFKIVLISSSSVKRHAAAMRADQKQYSQFCFCYQSGSLSFSTWWKRINYFEMCFFKFISILFFKPDLKDLFVFIYWCNVGLMLNIYLSSNYDFWDAENIQSFLKNEEGIQHIPPYIIWYICILFLNHFTIAFISNLVLQCWPKLLLHRHHHLHLLFMLF